MDELFKYKYEIIRPQDIIKLTSKRPPLHNNSTELGAKEICI